MIEYWTNFAKYGNPSPFLDTDIPHWKPYGQEKVNAMKVMNMIEKIYIIWKPPI